MNRTHTENPMQDAPSLDAVAIIGMACRFPEARDVDEFWRNVRDGVESVSHFSDEELLALGHDPLLLKQPNYVKSKGIVDGVDLFDAAFFGFSPREAEVMDPQHRLFLESAWTALEDAGYDAPRFQGRIGVFAGVGANTYLLNNLLQSMNPGVMSDTFQMAISNDKDFVPTRAAYLLNLTGPGVAINTGCSSALVAVSLAVQSLLSYQCDMMLAGGVSLSFPHKTGYLYQPGMVASPDGRCRAFDAKAQGAVGGEGVGIVVLKRLGDALADGDTIHAVIRGCAINNDGAHKVGFTAPGVDGQAAVIAEALAMAEVAPETITYVEAHGSGTALGDPIEIAALKMAFQANGSQESNGQQQYCAIGSVKTNIGHADTAAGVAGLIKTVQALKHGQVPPSLHYSEPNPQIDFTGSPFYVNDRLRSWPQGDTPRRAGVSSFGIGGTNAHVVLEEAPHRANGSPSRSAHLLPLAAKTPTALAQAAANLAAHLQAKPELNLADVAFTQSNRRPFLYRGSVIAGSTAETIERLRQIKPVFAKEDPQIAFVFAPGELTNTSVAQGRLLYASESVFRNAVDRCIDPLPVPLHPTLISVLSDSVHAEETAPPITTFVIEYALAQLWMTWGVRPVALMGSAVGELVAACVAGILPLAQALTLLAHGDAPATLNTPKIPLISSETGTWLCNRDATDAKYWLHRLNGNKQMDEGFATLGMSADLLVVIGADDGVVNEAAQHADLAHAVVVSTLPTGHPQTSVTEHLLTAVGRLWEEGVPIDWDAYYQDEKRRRLPLPTYPFERQSYWVAGGSRSFAAKNGATSAGSPVAKQARPELAIAYTPPQTSVERWLAEIWQNHLGIEPIGRDDDFFEHLAGQSLSAMGLISRIQEKTGADLLLQVIFEAPTIGLMASYLAANHTVELKQIGVIDVETTVAQKNGDWTNGHVSQSAVQDSRTDPNTLLEQLGELSEDELDAMLTVLLEEES